MMPRNPRAIIAFSGGPVRVAFKSRRSVLAWRSGLGESDVPAATAKLLGEIPLLSDLDADELTALAAGARVVEFAAGEELIAQGDMPDGAYRILTIRPGSYPATADWVRPPHIHYMAHAEGRELLTTQMYFADDPLNDADRIFGSLSPGERARVAVAFDQRRADGVARGTFDLIVG